MKTKNMKKERKPTRKTLSVTQLCRMSDEEIRSWNRKNRMALLKQRAQARRRAENKLHKVMSKNGFSTNITHTDFGNGIHGYQFGLYKNGVMVNVKQRKDGSYYVTANVLDWLAKEIEKSGFDMTPRPKLIEKPAENLRLVG